MMIAFWLFSNNLNLVVFAFYDTYQRLYMPCMLGDIIINFTIFANFLLRTGLEIPYPQDVKLPMV